MPRTILIRAGSSVAVFLIIAVGLFSLVRLAPGDPVEMMVPPDAAGPGRGAYVEELRARLGLDESVPVQFVRWFGNLMTGDLGYSFSNGQPVTQLLGDRLLPTVMLMGAGLTLGLLVSIPAGILAAARRNTVVDYTVTTLSVTAISVPGFFLAMLAIYVLSVRLSLLPSAGMYSSGRSDWLDLFQHMVLPVSILALTVAATFTRYVRSGMLEELDKDYVRAVVAKGAKPARVLAHAFRNSLVSLVTVLALFIPMFLAGAVVLEQVFAWPGMGQLAVSAIETRDYPVVIGFGLYVAILVLVCNLVADVLYAIVDPRVRTR